jgi:transposase-like protein
VRDIEDAIKNESGRLLPSRTAVSELGARLWEDYQAFAHRDLSEYEIVYLFVDGIAERLRAGAKREPVLAAWGHTVEGRRVLLHLMAGSKENGVARSFAVPRQYNPERCPATDLTGVRPAADGSAALAARALTIVVRSLRT